MQGIFIFPRPFPIPVTQVLDLDFVAEDLELGLLDSTPRPHLYDGNAVLVMSL